MKEQRIAVKDIYGEVLSQLGKENPDIYVVEADLMKASGSRPFKELFPDRHINVGVAEQNLVGTASGIAAAGGIPFACTMANFMAKRACDQVAMSVAYNMFNVKLVGCYAGLTQEKNGGTHVSFIDIGVMRSLPGMKVFAPGDGEELRQVLEAAAEFEGPVYIRMAKLLQADILGEGHRFEIGRAYRYGEGGDLTIVSTGLATEIALDSLEALRQEGIEARVLHVPTIKPFDAGALEESVRETGAVITLEDHSVLGGLGGLVTEILAERYPAKVSRIGLNDSFGLTAGIDFQLEYFGITPENVVARAKSLLAEK